MDITHEEISNQPDSWRKTLNVVAESWPVTGVRFDAPHTHVLFIGCGTSFYLAQSAARLFQEVTGVISTAVPASEVLLAGESTVPKGVPVVAFAISRSGTTSEILLAVQHLHEHYSNVRTVGVTCHSEKHLATTAEFAICLDHARERSVVMTQSFTNMLLALQWIAAYAANRIDLLDELKLLPSALSQILGAAAEFADPVGKNRVLTQFIYLGLGTYYGLAKEGTLKLKEMTQTPCEPYSPLEFRHGPISMVKEGTATIFLASDTHKSYIRDVIDDVKKLGAKTVVLAPASIAGDLGGHVTFPLPNGFTDWARTILYMPPLQFLAHARAIAMGLDPDQPRNLSQVVVLSRPK